MLLSFFIWAQVINWLDAHGDERYAGQVYKIISLNGSPTQNDPREKPTRITTLRAGLKERKIEENSFFEEPTTTATTSSTSTSSPTSTTSSVADTTSSKNDESSTLVIRSIKAHSEGPKISSSKIGPVESILQNDFYSQLRKKKSKRHFLTPFQDLIVKKSELFTRAKIVTTSSTTTIVAPTPPSWHQTKNHQASWFKSSRLTVIFLERNLEHKLVTWKIIFKVNYEPRGNLDDWNLGLSWSKIALDLNPHSLLRKLRGI